MGPGRALDIVMEVLMHNYRHYYTYNSTIRAKPRLIGCILYQKWLFNALFAPIRAVILRKWRPFVIDRDDPLYQLLLQANNGYDYWGERTPADMLLLSWGFVEHEWLGTKWRVTLADRGRDWLDFADESHDIDDARRAAQIIADELIHPKLLHEVPEWLPAQQRRDRLIALAYHKAEDERMLGETND